MEKIMPDSNKEEGDSWRRTRLEILAQIHASEYQALTTRATYFMTIIFSIAPLCVIYLTLIAQAVKPSNMSFTESFEQILTTRDWVRSMFFWGNLVVLQFMALLYTNLVLEVYGITLYLETELKPLLMPLVKSRFWIYEAFQAEKRNKLPTYGEWVITIAVALVILVIAKLLWMFVCTDWIGLLVNLCLLKLLGDATGKIIDTRKEWVRSWRLRGSLLSAIHTPL